MKIGIVIEDNNGKHHFFEMRHIKDVAEGRASFANHIKASNNEG
jgi:hypothetical protein